MNEQKRESISKLLEPDGFGFYIRWRALDHWADFEVFRVESIFDGETAPNFHRKDWRNFADTTQDMDEAEPFATGYIKWDGCAQFDMSQHLCGPRDFGYVQELLKHLYLHAPVTMGRGRDGLDEPWANSLPGLSEE